MSDNTSVAVRDAMGARVPSLSQLNVIAGQTITFRAVDAASTLYFSPDLIGILTPTPDLSASLVPDHDLTYTFSSADPGAYEIVFQSPELAAPQTFDPPTADHTSFLLILKTGTGAAFGLTSNPIQTVNVKPVQALHAASKPLGIMGSAEGEDFTITSNPIQT